MLYRAIPIEAQSILSLELKPTALELVEETSVGVRNKIDSASHSVNEGLPFSVLPIVGHCCGSSELVLHIIGSRGSII